MPRCSTRSASPWRTSASLSASTTRLLSVRPWSRSPPPPGTTLVVWTRSSGNSRRLFSTLSSTRKSSSSTACRLRRVYSSTVPPVPVRPCWPRPSQTSARPISSRLRALNCSPCGLVSPRPTSEMSSTRLVLPPLVSCSSMSSTRSPRLVEVRVAMQAVPATVCSTRSLLRWTV